MYVSGMWSNYFSVFLLLLLLFLKDHAVCDLVCVCLTKSIRIKNTACTKMVKPLDARPDNSIAMYCSQYAASQCGVDHEMRLRALNRNYDGSNGFSGFSEETNLDEYVFFLGECARFMCAFIHKLGWPDSALTVSKKFSFKGRVVGFL